DLGSARRSAEVLARTHHLCRGAVSRPRDRARGTRHPRIGPARRRYTGCVAASIYLTSAEGRTGKSAVALGVLNALLSDAPRVGVFRPLIRSASTRDRVLELLLASATADVPY